MGAARWILDELPVGVWVAQVPTGEADYSNQAFVEILGIAAVEESRIGDAPATYQIHNRQGAPYPADQLPFSRAVATGQRVVADDLVIYRPDGRRVNVRAHAQPVRDPEGTITHVIVAFTDITREIEAVEQRQTMETRLAFVVNHAPVAVFTVDRRGFITLSEGAGLAGLGVRSGELVGKSIFDLYSDHPEIPPYIRRALSGESFWYSVTVGATTFDTWITPLRDDDGEVVGATGISQDVSEMRRLQQLALQNDRINAMGMLAASVAHEINNPLTYVLGNLTALLEVLNQHDGPRALIEEVRSWVQPAIQGAERVATIARELRTFGRSDDTATVVIDLSKAVQTVLTLVAKEIAVRATLELNLAEDCVAEGSPSRMVQVILNLVTNAMQALETVPARSPARIAITTTRTADQVWLEVADTGPGVPDSVRGRIFDPFFSTKELGVGTGLGLFVCRNIVRQMGGEISLVDIEGGQRGACFRVSLPRARPQPAPREAPPAPVIASPSIGERAADNGAPSAAASILVVDDDPLVNKTLTLQLRSLGHRVVAAHSGQEALDRLLTGENFDLIYCDLMMHGLSGMELAVDLERRRPEVTPRIVFMTGGAFTPDAQKFVDDRRDQTVSKPFDVVAETGRRLARR